MKIGNHKLLKIVMKSIYPDLDDKAFDYFTLGLSTVKLKRKEEFISPYSKQIKIGFINVGLVKGYYIDKDGNEINTRFMCEGNFVADYKSFISQEPSRYYFKAIEPTTLLVFNYNHVQDCYANFPSFQIFGRKLAESMIVKLDSRLESQHSYDAAKRYLHFINEYPNLAKRLSLEDIASYIRITRPSLSRLKNKLS
jgi:CRP-like cAMP-binding protein